VAPMTDEQLMLAFVHGDRASFDELFLRYRQAIYGFHRRRVPDRSRAEELTQDTFLALLRAAGRYQPRALFRTYLYAIAFRILSVDRRKAALRSFFFLPLKRDASRGEPASDEVLWLRQALERLDPTDREILLLREFDEFTYAEMAELLRLPLNTVRSRLFRARMALRESLEGARQESSAVLGELS
jgi:RNA polymerase sigma-70 factor, ECF subfamily